MWPSSSGTIAEFATVAPTSKFTFEFPGHSDSSSLAHGYAATNPHSSAPVAVIFTATAAASAGTASNAPTFTRNGTPYPSVAPCFGVSVSRVFTGRAPSIGVNPPELGAGGVDASATYCPIHSVNALTRVYTPGEPAWAHPSPHDTMPTSTGALSASATNGPPLSPTHES